MLLQFSLTEKQVILKWIVYVTTAKTLDCLVEVTDAVKKSYINIVTKLYNAPHINKD